MNYLIGDSRVGGFKNKLSKFEVEDVWFKPGGRFENMNELVLDLTILHHGEDNQRAHFYIWAGICNLTKKLRGDWYEEVIFSTEEAENKRHELHSKIEQLSRTVTNQYAFPIFCPIIPMEIKTWNEHRMSVGRTNRLVFHEEYKEMQKSLEEEVTILNNHLIKINNENGMATPMLHNDFLHNRGKGRVSPRYKDLSDGCHATDPLIKRFKKSLLAAIETNKKLQRG